MRQMLVVLVFLFCGIAYAENKVEIDLTKLSPEMVAQVMEAQSQAKNFDKGIPTPTQMEQWTTLGTNLGQAIGATAKELSIGVNEFIKTPIGKVTAAVIIWKVVGRDIWRIVGGIMAWVVIASIVSISFRRFHFSERVENKEGEVRYVPRYEFSSDDARTASVIVHVVIFIAITIATMVLVFM